MTTRVKRPPRQAIPQRLREEILDNVCAYCGAAWPTEVDHIIPYSCGGNSERDNLAAACWRCNHEKLDFTPEQWQTWRLSTGRPWPPPNPDEVLAEVWAVFPTGHMSAMSVALRAGDPAILGALNRIVDGRRDGTARSPADDAARLVVLLADEPQRRAKRTVIEVRKLRGLWEEFERERDTAVEALNPGRLDWAFSIYQRSVAEVVSDVAALLDGDGRARLEAMLAEATGWGARRDRIVAMGKRIVRLHQQSIESGRVRWAAKVAHRDFAEQVARFADLCDEGQREQLVGLLRGVRSPGQMSFLVPYASPALSA